MLTAACCYSSCYSLVNPFNCSLPWGCVLTDECDVTMVLVRLSPDIQIWAQRFPVASQSCSWGLLLGLEGFMLLVPASKGHAPLPIASNLLRQICLYQRTHISKPDHSTLPNSSFLILSSPPPFPNLDLSHCLCHWMGGCTRSRQRTTAYA